MNTKQTIKEAINADITREQIGIDLFNKLVEIFKPFEDKPITKRLATAVEKALPEYTVSYDTQFGHFNIHIWGNGISFDKRLSYFLGYDSSPTYKEGSHDKDHSGFRYYSGCYGFHAEKRNEQRNEQLKDSAYIAGIAKSIDAYKKSVVELEKISNYDFPSWYSVQKATGIDIK